MFDSLPFSEAAEMQPFLVVVACVLVLLAAEGDAKKNVQEIADCVHGKFRSDLGSEYADCYDKSKATTMPRIKQCVQHELKTGNVVKTAANGQMTVDKDKFSEKAKKLGSGKAVGKAMDACCKKNDDKMYEEAARAIQCMFEELKETCQ